MEVEGSVGGYPHWKGGFTIDYQWPDHSMSVTETMDLQLCSGISCYFRYTTQVDKVKNPRGGGVSFPEGEGCQFLPPGGVYPEHFRLRHFLFFNRGPKCTEFSISGPYPLV